MEYQAPYVPTLVDVDEFLSALRAAGIDRQGLSIAEQVAQAFRPKAIPDFGITEFTDPMGYRANLHELRRLLNHAFQSGNFTGILLLCHRYFPEVFATIQGKNNVGAAIDALMAYVERKMLTQYLTKLVEAYQEL